MAKGVVLWHIFLLFKNDVPNNELELFSCDLQVKFSDLQVFFPLFLRFGSYSGCPVSIVGVCPLKLGT